MAVDPAQSEEAAFGFSTAEVGDGAGVRAEAGVRIADGKFGERRGESVFIIELVDECVDAHGHGGGCVVI